MGCDALADYIRDEFLKAVSIPIQDQTDLLALVALPKSRRADEKAEFERHIGAGKLVFAVELGARNVVGTKTAGPDGR